MFSNENVFMQYTHTKSTDPQGGKKTDWWTETCGSVSNIMSIIKAIVHYLVAQPSIQNFQKEKDAIVI